MDKKEKTAAAAAIAATIAASGTAIDASFDNPAEILQADMQRTPKIEYVDIDKGKSGDSLVQDEKKQKSSDQTGFHSFILSLPLPVRVVLVLPLWIIGHALVFFSSLLFAGMTPLLNGLFSFLLLFAVITAMFTMTVKAIFPDLPLAKILNRHSFKWLLIASASIYAADFILAFAWNSYAQFKMLIELLMTLAGISSILIWFLRRERRRRTRLAQNPEAEETSELVYHSLGQTFSIRKPK